MREDIAGGARTLVIAHCIPNMWMGGGQRELIALAGEQVRRGHRVVVILGRGGPLLASLQATGAALLRVRGANHSPLLAWKLRRVLGRARPDVVQTWINQMDVLGGFAARGLSVPWVLCELNSAGNYSDTWKNRLRIRIARRADAVVSNSAGGDAYWHSRLPNIVLRRVIHNALPLNEIAAAPPIPAGENGCGPGETLVLYAGRLSPEKNVDVLIDALDRAGRSRTFQAVLCGDGTLEATVRERVRRRGLTERILVKGYVSDVWSWMKRADVFVSVSWFEGRPNAVLEAMACGCPLVLSDIPAHREIASEASAVFVDPASPDAIAAGILQCIVRREEAERRAETARASVVSFSVPDMARQFEELYWEVLERRGRVSARGSREAARA